VFGKGRVTPDRVKYASELTDLELTQTLREGVFQSHYADEGARWPPTTYAMDLHRAGLMARKYSTCSRYDGWGEVEPDGGAGLDAWAKTLQLRFADPSSPAHAWVQTIRQMVPPGGTIDGTALEAAKAVGPGPLDDEDLRHFIDHAEVFRQTRAGDLADHRRAQGPGQGRVRRPRVRRPAPGPGRGGTGKLHVQDLLDLLADGEVPDRSWLANNVPKAERPAAHAIGQLWAPYNPAHEPGTFPSGYTQMMSKAYDKVVTDQINALSRNPLVTALYMNARKNTKGYEKQLIEAGWSEGRGRGRQAGRALHAAGRGAQAHRQPVRGQPVLLVARNYAAFVRAQEDWLRRWGRTIQGQPGDDPQGAAADPRRHVDRAGREGRPGQPGVRLPRLRADAQPVRQAVRDPRQGQRRERPDAGELTSSSCSSTRRWTTRSGCPARR
jgi:hypothetical protein